MTAFRRQIPVRFHHCDPAALVYYPRYFEMVDAIIEDWFAIGLKTSIPSLLHRRAIVTPTVHLTVDFIRPSVYGETITFKLMVNKIGRTSCHITMEASKARELRMTVKQIIVFLHSMERKPVPVPPDIIKRMRKFVATPPARRVAAERQAAAPRQTLD
jgi:4-hydroxybenzoyl-CoA thioesterase